MFNFLTLTQFSFGTAFLCVFHLTYLCVRTLAFLSFSSLAEPRCQRFTWGGTGCGCCRVKRSVASPNCPWLSWAYSNEVCFEQLQDYLPLPVPWVINESPEYASTQMGLLRDVFPSRKSLWRHSMVTIFTYSIWNWTPFSSHKSNGRLLPDPYWFSSHSVRGTHIPHHNSEERQ